MSLLSYIYEDRCNSLYLYTADSISFYIGDMPVNKKILKITKEEYDELNKEYSYILDLYMSDNTYYVIGTFEDLKSVGLDPGVPFV
tara:strand:+ start:9952 stop:10209 length:258 start_codon:yes stop_codon:yes gene_type:complete